MLIDRELLSAGLIYFAGQKSKRELPGPGRGIEFPGQKSFFSRNPPKNLYIAGSNRRTGFRQETRDARITRSTEPFECTQGRLTKFSDAATPRYVAC
jgi:hypothetical protein